MPQQLRVLRTITVPAGTGLLLARVFRPGGARRGFADADAWLPDHLGSNLVLAGTGGYRAGRRSWPLRPGTLFLRRPGVRHSTWSDAAYAECSLGFAPAFLPQLLAWGCLPDAGLVFPGTPQPQAADELALFAVRLGRAGPDEDAELLAEAAALLARLWRRREQPGSPGLRRARAALDADPAAYDDLERLADLAGMTTETFRRSFRRAFGLGPGAYRQHRRLELAIRLLADGKAVKTVAADLGYGSPEAFTTHFVRHHGFPPGHVPQAP